jgi:acetoin utilization deacetylase AcuC-like enzyme
VFEERDGSQRVLVPWHDRGSICQALCVGQPLLVFSAADRDAHATPEWHPENRLRLDAALAGVAEAGLLDATEWREPKEASMAELAMAHDPLYVDAVRRFCEAGGGDLDPDTMATPGSWNTARRSAGAVLEAIDALEAGECELAFSAGRPPGHHAVRDRAMGFCLFNNAAVGAAKLAAEGKRVVVLDWDVHHGNGTQDIFYDDPRVLYVSTHESPLYPGTGVLRETGGPSAPRSNLNLPFPSGTRGDVYRAAFDEVITPVVEVFAPDWLIISAGFDGHRDDPLAGLQLTAADYADLAVRAASLVPASRVIVVLEGGYSAQALTRSVGATLGALLGTGYRPEPASTGEVGLPTITAARQLWELT